MSIANALFSLSLQMQNIMDSLDVMWKGMLGIFVVMVIILAFIKLMTAVLK